MNRVDLVEKPRLRDDLPEFAPGDTVRVHVRITEAGRERVQVFQGVVISRKNGGLRETFTVRKVSFGIGVERIFLLHSPIIAKIEVVMRGRVRRAKLYYLRELRGKRARIRERRDPTPPARVHRRRKPTKSGPEGMSSGPSTEDDVQAAMTPVASPITTSGPPIDPTLPSDPSSTPDGAPAKRRSGGMSFLQELPFLLLVAFVLALLIKTFLVQAFYIPSESMDPTLKIGDRVLVNKLMYHFHPPRHGDIIVFQDPHPLARVQRNPVSGFFHWLGEGLGVSTSADKDFIKRVIGLPGDRVEVRVVNGRGVVFVNNKPLTEPYLNDIKETRPYGPATVPKDQLFVMGDNRTNSNDSRYGLGFIPMDKVVGRAFVIIWPPSRFRWLSGIHYPGF